VPELVDHLAELTGFRDRALLDVTLASALRDLLRPRSLTVFRSVGDTGHERWLNCAHLAAGDLAASADPSWVDIDSLPLRSADAARLEAFLRHDVVTVAGSPHRSVFPLTTDRAVVGVLEVESDAPLDEKERRLVASILRIYSNFEALLDYSEHDSLTGLLNRKSFDESFMKAAAMPPPSLLLDAPGRRGQNEAGSHWVGVIDIDHFKRVNDRYGHLIGDEVLLLLARLMRSSFRFHDRLYRFGGEEFVVLMRCQGAEAAAGAFERLRRNVEAYAFPQVGSITVSIGFTELKVGDTPSGAFERADKAVYHAKGNGRNQVSSHALLVASGQLVEDDKVGGIELF